MENEKAKATAVIEVAPEQKIVIFGCVNPKVIEKVKKIVEEEGCELVMLADKVIPDNLQVKDPKHNKGSEQITLEQFLSNESNRIVAQEQAHKLWAILSKGKEIEMAGKEVFTEKQVCDLTTLSHSKANHLFNLLRAFGLFQWVDIKTRTFQLHFDSKYQIDAIEQDVFSLVSAVNNDILRFKHAIAATSEKEETEKRMAELKEMMLKILNF